MLFCLPRSPLTAAVIGLSYPPGGRNPRPPLCPRSLERRSTRLPAPAIKKSRRSQSRSISCSTMPTGSVYRRSWTRASSSILQSEVTKMTLRLREQNDALKQEKAHLADSLADIAHQLRTPLTSVNLVLSLLANQPGRGRTQGAAAGSGGAAYTDGLAAHLPAQTVPAGRGHRGFSKRTGRRGLALSTPRSARSKSPWSCMTSPCGSTRREGIEIGGDAGWLSEAAPEHPQKLHGKRGRPREDRGRLRG